MTEQTVATGSAENAEAFIADGTEMKTKKDATVHRTKKRHIVRKLITALLVLAILAGGCLYAYRRLKNEYTVTYDTYAATTGTISNSLNFSGSLSLIDSKSYSASEPATVREVYVEVGDNVKEGARLVRLSDGTTLKADFDGRINTLDVKKGDEVAAGDPLLQLADFEHMKASMRVDEYDIGDISLGCRCTVTATATGKKFESSVSSINYISSSGGSVGYYTCTADVTIGGEDILTVLPGMQVTVSVPKEEAADVVVLKEDALSFSSTNSAFVYKQAEDGTMEQVDVEVGVSNGNYVEIKSGVASGETVYAVSKTEEDSSIASLFSGMFGSTQINNRPGGSGWSGRDSGGWNGNGRGGSGFPGGGN